MHFSSLSAFLDSLENPTASHVLFWMAGRSSSPVGPTEAPKVLYEDESKDNNGVKVQVQKLLSSSALDDPNPLQPTMNIASVKVAALNGDNEAALASPRSSSLGRSKSEVLPRSMEPRNRDETKSLSLSTSANAEAAPNKPEEAHSCFTEFSDYNNNESDSPQPWEMANAPSFNSSIGGPLEVHPEVSERTETDRIYSDADLGASEMFYSDALDDLGRSEGLGKESSSQPEKKKSKDAVEPDFGASGLIYSDTLEEILDASLRIDEVLAEIEIEHPKQDLKAEKNERKESPLPQKNFSSVTLPHGEETELGSAGTHTESTHAESDVSLPHATTELQPKSTETDKPAEPNDHKTEGKMGTLEPTSPKAPKLAETSFTSCKPINIRTEKSKTDRFNNWKLIPPGVGEGDEMVVDGTTWYWCTKCARGKLPGRWSNTHGTSGHTGRVVQPSRGEAASSSTTAGAGGVRAKEMPAKHKRKLPVASKQKAQSTKDEEEDKAATLLPTAETSAPKNLESQMQPASALDKSSSLEPTQAVLPLSPDLIQSALAGSEPFTPASSSFSFGSLFASPASSVGERVPLEPHFEEIPMLLLNEMQKEGSSDVARALEVLSELLEKSRHDSGNISHRLGAHSIVLLAMRKHKGSEAVQAWGCRCLGLLGSLNPETTLAIILLGGLEVLLNAMNRFPATVSVQRNGCNTLLSMFHCIQSQMAISQKESELTPTAVISQQEGMAIFDRFVNEMHGPKILMRSMRKCLMVVRVLSPSCGIFSILAKAGHKKALKDAGAVSAVAVALENNPEDEELNRYASEFMVSTFAA